MELIIKGTPKEIADLTVELQGQHKTVNIIQPNISTFRDPFKRVAEADKNRK